MSCEREGWRERSTGVPPGEGDALMGLETCVRSDEVCAVCCINCTSPEMMVPMTEMITFVPDEFAHLRERSTGDPRGERDALMGPERVFALMSSLACEKQAQVFHGERDALMGRERCVRSDEVCVVCCNNCTSLEMIVPETELR
ncbi:hypothetical protein CEXT_341691 [Caerostris extrusa]|uniref:4Fe-4S ferredoxin-type domain-containing protein n=1 Tax=Caerostris extrusa TaxID=172846 RepID=A0AAV4PN52_CAEEX|nr:hypothetical protein CEXT_341691 [Caerostris extrusa]